MEKKSVFGRAVLASGSLSLVALSIAIALAISAASAAGAPAPRGAMPDAHGSLHKVIVLLRHRPTGPVRSLGHAAALRAEEAPLIQSLRWHGAGVVSTGHSLPFVVASVSPAQAQALKTDPSVRGVFPDATITGVAPVRPAGPPPIAFRGHRAAKAEVAPVPCGTAKSPENDPEALDVIKATEANALGYDGAGVSVAYIAGPIDTKIPDFQRNRKYASPGSPAGAKVVRSVNFTGDRRGIDVGDAAGESFLDAASIVAQGNKVYDLNDFVSPTHPLPKHCDITVTGAAPGATVLGLSAFSSKNQTTTSNFIQAIDYAVAHGVKVLNESFTSNNFPDTALDVTRIVDDEAVAAGVTVVVSTGDGGITNTLGSPATDPKVIAAGASTTFRAYEQDTFGGVNATSPFGGSGAWVNNNISSLSSGGFDQGSGRTVDVVAPGDLNWTLCSPNLKIYSICVGENGAPTYLQISGGTSESAPLTSAAAADVIQAYASTHGGADPSPALVKRILMSTATDIGAPAEQQGAGLLNVLAAVKEAASLHGTTGKPQGGLFIGPNQINVAQPTGAKTTRPITVLNTGSRPVKVHLSTRALTTLASHQLGNFCLNPSKKANACGPPTANSFQIWSGVTEVYQEEFFSVPKTGKKSRLNFSADYQYTGQASLLHVALFDPTGAYAGYSDPQGLGNYANVQVANPKHGTWMAVFFTEQDNAIPKDKGTSGTIQWQADTWTYGHAGTIAPSTLTIAPGKRATAQLTLQSPSTPGDTSESVVVRGDGQPTTIPVTLRTRIRIGKNGGDFSGVLTGGNGRDNPAQSNTYAFRVPAGKRDLDVSVSLADPNDGLVAFLLDPHGNLVASSSNTTFDPTGEAINGTGSLHVYKDNPEPGRWRLVLDWLQPVSGLELSEPFTGAVRFDQVKATAHLPGKRTHLTAGQGHTFSVTITNTSESPQLYFLDPRGHGKETIRLTDQNGKEQGITLPIGPGTFPFYIVPNDTSALKTSLTGSAPVAYDIGPFTGDPNLSPAVPAPGVTRSVSGNEASLVYAPKSGVVPPGAWYLNPSEVGPYPSTGATPVTADASFSAVTKRFDLSVTTATGDLWTTSNGLSKKFDPVYVLPGQSRTIKVTITPVAKPGAHVIGEIAVDDVFQANFVAGLAFASGDELASFPFSYTVGG